MNLFEPQIIYADDDYAVFYKPQGLPSAPLTESDTSNALFEAAKMYPSVMNVKSYFKNIEKGLLHRLDTNTAGLILLAGTQKSYNALIEQQQNNMFQKSYTAYVKYSQCTEENMKRKGFPACPFSDKTPPVTITSLFRKYGHGGREVRPVIESSMSYYSKMKSIQQEYTTELENLCTVSVQGGQKIFKARCRINRGFRHQVRCHLAWIGLPVIGDKQYGIPDDVSASSGISMFFFADALDFISPETGKTVHYEIDLSFIDNIFLTSASR